MIATARAFESPADVNASRRLASPFDGRARSLCRSLAHEARRARWKQYRSVWAFVDGETCRREAILRHGDRELAFISTRTTFGTALDVTVAELSIESFFPADEATREAMQELR